MSLLLNCDLGESFGAWKMGMDEAVMPHIDQANIACGFHAGDPQIMLKTLKMAKELGVRVGAHPAYPDLVGFGRRSMKASTQEIYALVQYQVAALDGMAASQGIELEYVKPHGALYNDMMADATVRGAIMQAVADYHRPIRLMLQATAQADEHRQEAAALGIQLFFEAFADRCYDTDGKLLSRTKAGAVHTREKMLEQVKLLANEQCVINVDGVRMPVVADTLCVHGDNQEGIDAIREIREMLAS